jgi:LPXTG-motif cell wall-anchored protein
MSNRSTYSVLGAAVLASTFFGWGGRAASAQTGDHKMAVTAVGCLQAEREYRRNTESSKFAGTGIGLNDEYVLIDAVIGGPSMNVQPITEQENSTNCIAARGTGQAFELTGHGEDSLAGLVGRRVVIHGMLKHAKHDTGPVGTSGTFYSGTDQRWTGPRSDLELREINVESFSLVPVMAAAKNEPVILGAPEPAPAAAPEPEPAPAAEAAPQQPAPAAAPVLPKTASPLPAIGLIGLLSLMGAAGLRLFRRQRS